MILLLVYHLIMIYMYVLYITLPVHIIQNALWFVIYSIWNILNQLLLLPMSYQGPQLSSTKFWVSTRKGHGLQMMLCRLTLLSLVEEWLCKFWILHESIIHYSFQCSGGCTTLLQAGKVFFVSRFLPPGRSCSARGCVNPHGFSTQRRSSSHWGLKHQSG